MAVSNLSYDIPLGGFAAAGNLFSGMGGDPRQAINALSQNYAQTHNAALNAQQANLAGQQRGWDTLRNDANNIYNNIYTNMDSRMADVLNRIEGTNATNINDINRRAEAASGAASQQMVSRGLGNTTVQQNMQRAIASDRAREQTASQNAFAQLQASYADRIWQDKTNAQMQKAQLMSNLGQGQLGMMERVNIGYPDAAMYGSLAQMLGASAEADKNRKLQEQAMARAGQGVMSSGGYTYSPSPWGSRNPAGSGGGGFGGGYDSWSSYGGGGGGGYYLPVGQGGNYTTDQYSGQPFENPYAAAMGNAAVYGGYSDPYGYGYYDQMMNQSVDEAVAAAGNWGY